MFCASISSTCCKETFRITVWHCRFIIQAESFLMSPADKINLGTQLRKAMDVAVYSLRYPEISIANYPGGQVYACLYTRNPASYIDDEFVRSYDEIQGEPYVEELLTQQRMFSWCQGSSPGIGSYIAFNRRLLEYRHLTDIGILQVRVPVSKLQQIFSAEQPESVLAYFYLDDLGALICSSTRNPLPDEVDLWDGEGRILDVEGIGQCIVTQAESHMNGGRLICFSSIHTLTESVDFITPVFIGGGIATMVLCAIILFFLSGSLVKGVGQLVRKTQRASSAADEYQRLEPISDTREIEELDAAYEDMVRTINRLHEDESRYLEAINEVQVELLQEQFNPHLLYNTLSLVRHVSQEEGEDARRRVANVLDSLISFYRSVLNRGQLVIRVRDEIKMIEDYLSIVREVYELDLDVTIRMDPGVLDCCSVKLFLQPIVENAVIHGLLEVCAGHLEIVGTRDAQRLFFVVEDDGTGIEPEKLADIRKALADGTVEGNGSFGFLSVSRRLRLFFTDDFDLDVTSAPGEGTRVCIKTPALTEDQVSAALRSRMI